MKFYIAHLLDDPSSGVLFWGATRDDALNFLADEEIEIDEQSIRSVRDPGAVLFQRRPGRSTIDVEELRYDGDLPGWDEDDAEEEAQARGHAA